MKGADSDLGRRRSAHLDRRRREEHPRHAGGLPGGARAPRHWPSAPARPRWRRSAGSPSTWPSSTCALGTESGLDLLPKLLGGEPEPRHRPHHRLRAPSRPPSRRCGAAPGTTCPSRSRRRRSATSSRSSRRSGTLTAQGGRARAAAGRRRRPDVEIASRVAGDARRAGDRGARRRQPTRRCCSAARAAPARASWRAPSTARARARDRPFVVTNCPTLSEELLESELFGHVEGRVHRRRPRSGRGGSRRPKGGTLFLDEIGEIPPALQAKLLRFLQEKDVRAGRRDRAPATPTCASSPRPTATWRPTSRPAASARTSSTGSTWSRCGCRRCASGARTSCRWRAPSSRIFARGDAGRCRPSSRRPRRRRSSSYDWPGNVRELRNAIERAAILWPAVGHRAGGLPGPRSPRAAQRRPDDRRRLHRRRRRARAHPVGARAGPQGRGRGRRCWASTPRRSGANARSTKGRRS